MSTSAKGGSAREQSRATASTIRPRRSVLYMPGSNRRSLDKARALPADALILDLEDAVAPDAKEAARATIQQALAERSAYGLREVIVRVNGLDTRWGHDDLVSMATAPVDAILLPKVESPDLVRIAGAILDAAGAAPDLPIWCMMETPRGVLRAEAIADHRRVGCLVMGTCRRERQTRGELARGRSETTLGALRGDRRAGSGCGMIAADRPRPETIPFNHRLSWFRRVIIRDQQYNNGEQIQWI
jgi:hypothetical protein